MIEKIYIRLLSRQDPSDPHTLLTRILVCSIILMTNIVLHGLYGLLAAIVVYLLGVELLGIERHWMFLPFLFTLFSGSWKGFRSIADYLADYGHG